MNPLYKNLHNEEQRNQLIPLFEKNITRTIVAGQDYIPVTGKIIDAEDVLMGIEATMDAWLTAGRFSAKFEKDFASYMGSRYAFLVNSGSSANLLAFYTLTSPKLGDRAIKPGDEVITVAAGFPTTVNPMVQFGCIPVFVDIDKETFNIDPKLIEAQITSKTSAIFHSAIDLSLGVVFFQDSKALAAALYARSISFSSESAALPNTSPVVGLIKSVNCPDSDS